MTSSGPRSTTGNVRKMLSQPDDPVRYTLPLGDARIDVNALIGHTITLRHEGEIHCVHCGRLTAKSFSQGYCFPCMRSLAQCDNCIVRPHTCHFHLGTCREPEWAETHCFQPHIVYLSMTSGLKVGITRGTQLPTRWIDQGAHQALPLVSVATRRQAGLIEERLAREVSDRTHWQRMLKGETGDDDLIAKAAELRPQIDEAVAEHREVFATPPMPLPEAIQHFTYPVLQRPAKVKAYNLDKEAQFTDRLVGIHGQYLIFENGVLNVRKYGGYRLTLEQC